jgi:hypothetical protein
MLREYLWTEKSAALFFLFEVRQQHSIDGTVSYESVSNNNM